MLAANTPPHPAGPTTAQRPAAPHLGPTPGFAAAAQAASSVYVRAQAAQMRQAHHGAPGEELRKAEEGWEKGERIALLFSSLARLHRPPSPQAATPALTP